MTKDQLTSIASELPADRTAGNECDPLVSVIICVYNAGVHLRPSVLSVLHQSYKKLEVIIVDDGTTDGCIQSIEDLADVRIRYFHQNNAGKPAALNLALREMNGVFYALQDADDLSHPLRIERQLKFMSANPDIAAVFCGHQLILGDKTVAPLYTYAGPSECRRRINRFGMPALDPTAMYRVEAIRGIEYAESLRIGQGYDYVLRVGERLAVAVLGECLYSYRVHYRGATRANPYKRMQAVYEVLSRRTCGEACLG